jgi:hypothetical protein
MSKRGSPYLRQAPLDGRCCYASPRSVSRGILPEKAR